MVLAYRDLKPGRWFQSSPDPASELRNNLFEPGGIVKEVAIALQIERQFRFGLAIRALRERKARDASGTFFAEGSRLRYDIMDRTGKVQAFLPADEERWYHPGFLWFRSWYYRIIDDPDTYGDNAAAVFCRKHAALQPLVITFYEVQEEKFTREDYLSGKSRMDPGFFTVRMLRGIRCPDP